MGGRDDQIAGKAKEFQSELTGSTDKETEGQVQNAVGKLEKHAEDAVDSAKGAAQPASELQLLLTIGIEGFRELVAWVAEGATSEERQARGEKANQAVNDVLKNVDRAKVNQALRDEAERLRAV
jgi:uncharacterized protein YjbJ (UPF0337 family)